ncbi:MAG: hypothetical protein LBQ49_00195 [Rickettsiales bacterium]|jgi:hypothetical protein|nr:hypothetical protein [Rickettsiales bacterium]
MREVEKNFGRCFNTPAGEFVLKHLCGITTERYLGANATEAELRGLEAQRALVHMIMKLAARE